MRRMMAAIVKRQDDHGNIYDVMKTETLIEAKEVARKFNERGHKQTYWAENIGSPC